MPNLSQEIARGATRVAVACLVLVSASAFAGRPASTEFGIRTFTPWDGTPPPMPEAKPEFLELGARVFRGACVGCHGKEGKGDGREGKFLPIPPRDLTTGQYSIRSTPSGTLPLETDLFRSIKKGFRSDVGMPPFAGLPDRDVWALVLYLKTIAPRWQKEKPGTPIEIPPAPPRTAALVKAGAQVFKDIGCMACHGELGRGDGPSARDLKYDTGKPIRPPDFTIRAHFKGGSRPEDIYRTLTTGMDGTPMPSFVKSTTPEQRWQLAYFILSFSESDPTAQR